MKIGKRRNDKNCLYPHNSESMKHWLIKAIIFKLLYDCNRIVRTETEIDGYIVDILDESNLIAYEVETKIKNGKIEERVKKLWKLHDVFIIDVQKVPDWIDAAVEYLKKKIV